jgi:lipopolysaccharide export system protein LptA
MQRVKKALLDAGALAALLLSAAAAFAQNSPIAMDSKEPIEVASDTLEVLQNEKKAIFTGNVIATQGKIKMRGAAMTIFYRESSPGGAEAPAADTSDALGKGIYRIEAEGNVIFTTPTEIAEGKKAVYDVDAQTITLEGDVTLTRGKNILKGTAMTYNLATGRSVLSSAGAKPGTGRVRGLFVPNEKPASPPATPPAAQPKGAP